MIPTISLKSKKSARFLVNKGYFSKWGIITLIKASSEFTVKYTDPSLLRIVIFPTPKKDCILFNKTISLLCKLIEKAGLKLQPVL